ncbi:MAG: hypothetical protein WAO91_06845 [Candidatus Nitrosotenuis sp.]
MKALGLFLCALLAFTILVDVTWAEPKTGQQKTKHQVKKDIKEIKSPGEDRSVKITSIKKSRTLSIVHIVGLEVCAGREKLYSPELDLKSDRESITVKVSGLIMPKMCKSAEFFIRAGDPDTITASFSKPIYYVQRQ